MNVQTYLHVEPNSGVCRIRRTSPYMDAWMQRYLYQRENLAGATAQMDWLTKFKRT